MLKEVEVPQPLDLGVVNLVFTLRLGMSKAMPGTKSTWMVSRRCTASKSTVCTNTARRCPALPQIIGWSSRPPTVDWSIPQVRMVKPLRQPSWSSACGFVDGGRTPRGRAFRPPAAHNSTGSTTTTMKLSINELHPPTSMVRPRPALWPRSAKALARLRPT